MNDILSYYGGEDIGYYLMKNNDDMKEKLSKIGTPIIIEFYFKYDDLSEGSKIEIKSLVDSNNKYTEGLLETIELRIENIITDKIQGYYILDKNNFTRKSFERLK